MVPRLGAPMRHATWALVLLLAALLAGLAHAPRGPEHAEVPAAAPAALEPASLPAAEAACVGAAPEARVTSTYVALRWDRACGAAGDVLWRGPSAAELVPLVALAHAGHVDVDVAPGAFYAYAVAPAGGLLGPATAVAMPSHS
jgi:hypothetical protein